MLVPYLGGAFSTAYVNPSPINYGTAAGDNINGGANGTNITAGLHATTADNGLTDSLGGLRIYGLAGNDTLAGTAHSDTLVGGDGTDLLRGGVGCDQLYGGAGSDQFYFKAGDLGTTYASGMVVTAAMWNTHTGGDMIMDFQGAGGFFATNNDIISFKRLRHGRPGRASRLPRHRDRLPHRGGLCGDRSRSEGRRHQPVHRPAGQPCGDDPPD